MQRLLEFAKQAPVSRTLRRRVKTWADLQWAMNASSQALHNWKQRGISKDAALEAEAKFGCSATWLLSGELPPGFGDDVHMQADEGDPEEGALLAAFRALAGNSALRQRAVAFAEGLAAGKSLGRRLGAGRAQDQKRAGGITAKVVMLRPGHGVVTHQKREDPLNEGVLGVFDE